MTATKRALGHSSACSRGPRLTPVDLHSARQWHTTCSPMHVKQEPHGCIIPDTLLPGYQPQGVHQLASLAQQLEWSGPWLNRCAGC
jgi:hypothetical protein